MYQRIRYALSNNLFYTRKFSVVDKLYLYSDGINVSEREEFVRFCFSSLLEFVLKGPTNVSEIVELQSGENGKKVAVLALLQRFQNILLNYKEYVSQNSHIPIQRYCRQN